MNKQKADKILTEYLPRIYGFAVKKSFSYDEAEEICADIVKELYESLLKSKEIRRVYVLVLKEQEKYLCLSSRQFFVYSAAAAELPPLQKPLA